MKVLGYKLMFNEIFDTKYANCKHINVINVDFKFKNAFTKISASSNNYIKKCFDLSINLLKNNRYSALINGPISKTHFLKKKFPGITEYVSHHSNSKDPVMLIYNKFLAVSPLTTHVPIKRVANFINSELYGRETDVLWSVVFIKVDNISRHPSQIYEAVLEGLILFFIMFFFTKKNYFLCSSLFTRS